MLFLTWSPSKHAKQHMHLPSLINFHYLWRSFGVLAIQKVLSKTSSQTTGICRLFWVLSECTNQKCIPAHLLWMAISTIILLLWSKIKRQCQAWFYYWAKYKYLTVNQLWINCLDRKVLSKAHKSLFFKSEWDLPLLYTIQNSLIFTTLWANSADNKLMTN